MNINDIMLRDMAEAKKRAELEEAESDARVIRRSEKLVNIGCALLWVLAVATLSLLAWICVSDGPHKWTWGKTPATKAATATNHLAETNAPAK